MARRDTQEPPDSKTFAQSSGTADPRISDRSLAATDAAQRPDDTPADLTKNEALVWQTLSDSHDPLKAYEILDELKTRGVRAPMTVYRALDGLEEKGLIHKLEAMNSFMVCNHEGPHEVQVFLVCEACQKVEEVGSDGLDVFSMPAMRRRDFRVKTARLEVKGQCANCPAGD